MSSPFDVVIDLVDKLLSSIKEVKTNHEGCELLAKKVRSTLRIVLQLNDISFESSVATTVELVKDALKEAQETIDKCCQTSLFSGLLYHENHDVALKHAMSKLENACVQISLVQAEIYSDVQTTLSDLPHQLNRNKFEQTAAMVHQVQELREVLERGYFKEHKQMAEVKELVQKVITKHIDTREQIKGQIDLLMKEILEVRKDKEAQMEYELSEVIATIHESMKYTKELPLLIQESTEHLCCPITKDILKDPVLLVESGVTYDLSSINDWFSKGNSVDPITRIGITTTELVPNYALKEICNTFLLEQGRNVSIPNDLHAEKHKSRFVPEVIQISQLIMLKPGGKVIGCTLYTEKSIIEQENKLEIGNGELVNGSHQLFFRDDYYFYNGNVTLGDGYQKLHIEWKGKVSEAETPTDEYDFNVFYSPPQIGHSVWTRPSIFEIEGDVVTSHNNVRHVSKAVLVLEADSSINGFLWFENASLEPMAIGHISGGKWDSDGLIKLIVYFSKKTRLLNLEINPRNIFATFEMIGTLITCENQNLLTFTVEATNIMPKEEVASEVEPPYVPLNDIRQVCYPYLKEVSIPWHRFGLNPMSFFQPSKDYELKSGHYFVRTEIHNGNDSLPYYLCARDREIDFTSSVDTYVSWAPADAKEGEDEKHFADIWEVQSLDDGIGYRISLYDTQKNKEEDKRHVGKTLNVWFSNNTDTNHNESYLCLRKTERIEDQCVWTLRKFRGGLNLVLEGDYNPSIGDGKEYFVSNLMLKKDGHNWDSCYATLSQSPKHALKVTLNAPRF
eukprot:g8082.t1